MLSSADADLVARDPALPGLPTLLDPAAFASILRIVSPAFADAIARGTYVRYKPGTRCLVGYEVRTPASTLRVHASAYCRQRWTAGARSRIDAPGVQSFAVGSDALVITPFPGDARVRVLAPLGNPATRGTLLRKLLPTDPSLHGASVTTLAYNPERRYVGLLDGEGTRAVIKLYADEVFARARLAVARRRASQRLKTPLCIGRSRRHRALVLEWLPGERLTDVLASGQDAGDCVRRAGRALAELHRELRRIRIDDQSTTDAIDVAASGVAALCPPLADRAARLATAVEGGINGTGVRQPIHGDFYAGQVLDDGERIGILDLDRVTMGDPASDVGNFVAHLEYAVLAGELSPGARDAAADAFLEAYERENNQTLGSRVDACVAAGLLALVSRPFRTRATDWDAKMSAVLDRVESRIAKHHGPARQQSPVAEVVPSANLLADGQLGLPPEALDCKSASHYFARLPRWRCGERLSVSAIRVIRHKPGRRCLLEYDVEFERTRERRTIIGKVKAKGADRRTFELTRALRQLGFDGTDSSGIAVPEPIGVFAEWKMWLQSKVAGTPPDDVLAACEPSMLGLRAAEVVQKLQCANLPAARTHTAVDELRILRERLSETAADYPAWTARLEALAEGCDELLASLPPAAMTGVHRDFHPGQLILDGERVHLLDLDLYAMGDPALDVGNFLAHLGEWSLRCGEAQRLAACEEALTKRFLELEPSVDRRRLEAYRLVSLARHVQISRRFPERRPFTERILQCCEQELARFR